MNKNHIWKLGDKTKDIWCGDLVSECEYICGLEYGNMLFYDTTFKCFRRVYPESGSGKYNLNGWICANKPSELLLKKKI